MSNVKNGWVAFPDVAEATEGSIILGYTGLPNGLDPDRLQLNAGVLQRGVIEWGGYSALTLAAYKGDEDSYAVGIGTDGGGNAYGVGSATVAKAESSQLRPISDSDLNSLDIRNGSLGIQWNINALNSRIEAHEQYDPAIRAKQISREIGRGTIRGIFRHNLEDTISDKLPVTLALYLGLDGWFASAVTRSIIQEDYGLVALQTANRAFLLGVIIRGLKSWSLKGVTFRNQIIDPLLLSARPTRAAIGVGVIASSRLVRPTPVRH